MDGQPLRQWIGEDQELKRLVGLAVVDVERALDGRPVPQRCDEHLLCCLLAEMARDLSTMTTTPSQVGAELAAHVYRPEDRSTWTDLKRAALGAVIARAVGGSFAGSDILAIFAGAAAVAACRAPDAHPGLYGCCDPAIARLAVNDVPAELRLLAGWARQVDLAEEHRSAVPARTGDVPTPSVGIARAARAPRGLAELMEELHVTSPARVGVDAVPTRRAPIHPSTRSTIVAAPDRVLRGDRPPKPTPTRRAERDTAERNRRPDSAPSVDNGLSLSLGLELGLHPGSSRTQGRGRHR